MNNERLPEIGMTKEEIDKTYRLSRIINAKERKFQYEKDSLNVYIVSYDKEYKVENIEEKYMYIIPKEMFTIYKIFTKLFNIKVEFNAGSAIALYIE